MLLQRVHKFSPSPLHCFFNPSAGRVWFFRKGLMDTLFIMLNICCMSKACNIGLWIVQCWNQQNVLHLEGMTSKSGVMDGLSIITPRHARTHKLSNLFCVVIQVQMDKRVFWKKVVILCTQNYNFFWRRPNLLYNFRMCWIRCKPSLDFQTWKTSV